MEKLNVRHKRVIDLWFERGRIMGSNIDAYVEVYPNSSRESARIQFSKLITRDNVKAYVIEKEKEEAEYLKQTKWKPQIMKKSERLALLSAHARGEAEWRGVPLPANHMAMLKAMDILEKHEQFYDRLSQEKETAKDAGSIDASKLTLEERIQFLELLKKQRAKD